MGNNASSNLGQFISTEQVQAIDQWTGRDNISIDNSDLWYTLCSIQAPLHAMDKTVLDQLKTQYTTRMAECNDETHNCGKLMLIVRQRLESFFHDPKASQVDLYGIANAFLFFNTILTQFDVAEDGSLLKLFEIQDEEDESVLLDRVHQLINCLMSCVLLDKDALTDDVQKHLFDFQLQSSMALLILCAHKMRLGLITPSCKPNSLVVKLLYSITSATASLNSTRGKSVLDGIFSFFSSTDATDGPRKKDMVRNVATLLLLVLVFSDDGNQYRKELSSVHGAIDPTSLCVSLAKTVSDASSTMLLYTLLYTNMEFRMCAIDASKDFITSFMMQLYSVDTVIPRQLYMIVVCLLIFSQHEAFCLKVHAEIMLPRVEWYTERSLQNISLGSLLMVILLRLIHKNMTQFQDSYIHTNSFAALCNLASYATGLHQHAAEKLVEMMCLFFRKETLMLEHLEVESDIERKEKHAAYVECVRLLLDVTARCLSPKLLSANSQLIYALLQQQDTLSKLKQSESVGSLSEGIHDVVECFQTFIEGHAVSWTIECVLEHIHTACEQIHADGVHAPIQFQYDEDAESQNFFKPYIWDILLYSTSAELEWHANCSSF